MGGAGVIADRDFIRLSLDDAYERLKDEYVRTSALAAVREYSPRSIVDLECWALFCATVDFQVPVARHLVPMLRGLLRRIEGLGLKFIDLVSDEGVARSVLESFEWGNRVGFRHRFLRVEHAVALLRGLGYLLEAHGSVGELVRRLYREGLERSPEEPLEHAIKELAGALRGFVSRYVADPGDLGRLVPDPGGPSAMKRLCLYFRWMVRPYPDLGQWTFIDRRHLLVSLDEGVSRVLRRALGLRIPRVSWEAVRQVTAFLRSVNPSDPAKYDYVLSRPAIMGYCARSPHDCACTLCPLSTLCRSARLPEAPPPQRPLSPGERELLERFVRLHSARLGVDERGVLTEYPIGRYRVDAVLHSRDCTWYVVEVERELNDQAVGQVIKYRAMLYRHKRVLPRAVVVCERADPRLAEALRVDPGIEIVVV